MAEIIPDGSRADSCVWPETGVMRSDRAQSMEVWVASFELGHIRLDAEPGPSPWARVAFGSSMRLFVLAIVVTLQVACGNTSDVSTEIRVRVSIDDSLEAQLLSVRVFDTNRALVSDEVHALAGAELPIILPLFPDGEGERSYHVVMELLGSGGASLGVQRVISAYIADESRILRVHFPAVCSVSSCSGQETCRDEVGVAECVQACFEPQRADDESLPSPGVCPNAVYVDDVTGVDDSGACFSPETPCKGVGYALDEYLGSRTGGTIYVAGGATYDGFGLGPDHSGTAATPTVVRGWPGTGRPIFEGDGTRTVIGTCCSENSANHLVFDGLEVRGGGGQGIQLHGRAVQDAIIRDCVVTGTVLRTPVPFASQAGAIVVTNRASNVLVIGNIVRDNLGLAETAEGESVATIGISVTGAQNTLEDNQLENNNGHGILMLGDDNRIIRNRIVRSGLNGILLIDASDVVIEDNVVCASTEHGIEVADSQRGEIRHNTIVRSGMSGMLLRDSSNEWTVRQNIFAYNTEFGLARLEAEESEPSDSQNLYWMNAGGAMGAVMGDGMNWVDVDPGFVNLEACDVTLEPGSGAAGLIDGGPVGVRPPG